MSIELAVITSEFLEDFVRNVLSDFLKEEDFIIYPYQSFRDLKSIFKSIPSHIKGVVVSGSFPAQVLRLSFPNTDCIIKEFNNDDLGLYKLFFKLLHTHRDLQLDRVYADVLDVAGIEPEEYLLKPFKQTLSDLHLKAAQSVDLDNLTKIEELMTKRHIEKWKNGEIDISITRFSSIMEKLKQAGLPVYFAYPDRNYVKSIIISTIQEVTISNLKGNMLASIFVTTKKNKDDFEDDSKPEKKDSNSNNIILLIKALKNFSSLHNVDYLIQEKLKGVEIITNRKFISSVTDNFQTCNLQNYLNNYVDAPVYIGYGIGNSLYQARINAMDANGEASKFAVGTSSLINDKDQLISPLNKKDSSNTQSQTLILPSANNSMRNLARKTGLSTLNIQKLVSVMESIPDKCITSQELSYRLHITRRSANRLLHALKENGYAKIVDKKRGVSLGRPEFVYEIKLF